MAQGSAREDAHSCPANLWWRWSQALFFEGFWILRVLSTWSFWVDFRPRSNRVQRDDVLWHRASMQASPTVFSQITAALYPVEFSRCVELFPGRRPPRGLSEYDHFLALCFGQLTYRESL